MPIPKVSLAGLAVLAAAPLLGGCVAPPERHGPDPQTQEQIHRLANHVEEMGAAFRQRQEQQEELRHHIHRFMERVERLEVALRQRGGEPPRDRPGEYREHGGEAREKRPVPPNRDGLRMLDEKMAGLKEQMREIEMMRRKLIDRMEEQGPGEKGEKR